MSNKSGISSQVISLPKGVVHCTGLARSSRPIYTPERAISRSRSPCRLGAMSSSPSSTSSTAPGPAMARMGRLGLSIPGVSRKTSKGNPHYDDSTADRFRRPHDPAGQQPRFDLQVKNIRRTAVEIARHVRQRTARETNLNQ
jgi:hypothetical protein